MSQDRLHLGVGHELAVHDHLVAEGWAVQKWGQGLLHDEIRSALGAVRPVTYWRWLPDLIAVRGSKVVLIDAKGSLRTDTPNFSLEVDAWMAHRAMQALGLPIVYVWSDFTVNTPDRLQPIRWDPYPTRQAGRRGASGTPMLLVRKADQHPFEWAFGRRQAVAS